MSSRKQQVGETSIQYLRDKQRLCLGLELTDAQTKMEVLCGLRDKDLANIMRAKTHTDIDNLAFDITPEQADHQRSLPVASY